MTCTGSSLLPEGRHQRCLGQRRITVRHHQTTPAQRSHPISAREFLPALQTRESQERPSTCRDVGCVAVSGRSDSNSLSVIGVDPHATDNLRRRSLRSTHSRFFAPMARRTSTVSASHVHKISPKNLTATDWNERTPSWPGTAQPAEPLRRPVRALPPFTDSLHRHIVVAKLSTFDTRLTHERIAHRGPCCLPRQFPRSSSRLECPERPKCDKRQDAETVGFRQCNLRDRPRRIRSTDGRNLHLLC